VAEERVFRVCADPNNLPFSNDRGEGFENRLAELVAGELGERVAYTWWAQRRGFVRNTLNAGLCDVIMGVPARFELVGRTRPYYRSTFVLAYRSDRGLALASIKDPQLARLKVGVQLIGDNGTNTPPAQLLGQRGIVENVVGYPVYGDYREANPPARIIEAVERGDIDVAAAWGPLAGYFAKRSPVPLTIVPIADAPEFRPLKFEYDISMGVRRGDRALHRALDEVIVRKQPQITALLEAFGVPLVEPPYAVHDGAPRAGGSD
jgi:quinoprotein dehydrogenase-associated probable ABC transporter substrate-binding protein